MFKLKEYSNLKNVQTQKNQFYKFGFKKLKTGQKSQENQQNPKKKILKPKKTRETELKTSAKGLLTVIWAGPKL
jgi:hypothetical protein